MKHFIIPATLIALLTVSCATSRQAPVKVNVSKTSTLTNATSNAIVYYLPKTVLRVEVEVEKSVMKAGPFFRYSERLLNISDVVMEDAEVWRIKSLKVLPVGRADFAQSYAIEMNGPGTAQNVVLNSEGVLCGINPSQILCTQVPSAKYEFTHELQSSEVNFDGVPKLEKLLKQTSTAAMAEEAANYIYKLRKRRSKIFSANYAVLPPDGEAFELTKAEMDTLETQFTELFTGKKETQTITRIFEFVPERVNPESTVLFRFSSNKGIVDRMDLSGAPVYIEIKNLSIPELPHQESKKEQAANGLYYMMPGKATVRLIDRNILMFEDQMDIAQFGQTLSMPASLLERQKIEIELCPATGALKQVKVND